MTFLTLPKIASLIPSQPIDRSTFKIPRNIKLADPNFYHPAPIEALLGVGTALSLLCIGQINISPPNGPDLYLQKTRLGWVIGGSTPATNPTRSTSCHTTTALQTDIAKFWEIEEGPQVQRLSKSEEACETHFCKNTKRDAEGRYVVALPFNGREQQLGESKSRATKRFLSLERKLQQEPETKQQYHEVMQEYIDLGHMSKVGTDQTTNGFYLPHHGVKKITSQTTKLRVVFDGSAETTTGISLNDALHTGPKIQDDLLYILLRFRIHQYVLTGDIEKMYRQIMVCPEDRRYQRVLWRDPNGEIAAYQLNTVTFGLSAAPFLAIRCLKQLAEDEGHRFPHASTILKRDFYVDDALTGTSTIEEGLVLRKNLTRLLTLAGMKIRQWASNDRRLLQGLSEDHINSKLHLGESSTVKTLGIYWNSSDDSIGYAVSATADTTRITKRSISSEIAKIYDPLGLLGPVIILAKLLLQQIWTMKIDWDESLIHTEWTNYYTQLPLLNNATFKRMTTIELPTIMELHGFCDASEKAYGACIYLRSIDTRGNIQVELLLAKSKVAPIKTQTIPRLELCGALLLSSLATTVQKALHVKINRSIFWTDSTIVLHWINTSPHSLKTFVANRISEIQTKTNITDWRHVRTEDNPADLITRGQSAVEFLKPSIWQQGPDWLKGEELHWPTWEIKRPTTDLEQKTVVCLTTAPIDTSLLERYSSWGRLQRIVALCLRWKRCNTQKGALTATELRQAHNAIVRLIQGLHFPEELRCLAKEKSCCIKGKLQRLNPFVDQDGVLRVGGRLKHSAIPFSKKHPVILPKSSVTKLIIENEHRIHLHAGVQATLYAVRQRYWPIDGRSQVWKAVKDCVRCYRAQPPPTDYVMGNLPAARVTESRPFTHTGVDYCGPFFIKEKKLRNRNRVKIYIAVFVCLAVKAVHLEVVSDLTSEGFIAALRRFIARRGFCISLHSDNGTNFVGANNELRELRDLLRSDDHNNRVQAFLSDRLIEWHFIPPQAPHFGGLWEAAVKSFKYHLKRVAGAELFTFESFNTLIIEIESILNSRPLTPISSDPNDLLVLTPGHFLIGDSLTSLRERDFRDVPANRLSSWQQIQKVKQHFWARWHREYLNELVTRSKWSSGSHTITEGTIVLLREDNIPPMQWALGRVTQVHPGSDGIVRTVTIKTATNVLVRSVKKLAPLPIEAKEEDSEEPATKGEHSSP
ncbi:PREDICTED: uncharacterized protein LOC108570076 [Habropoda laboriosa]|nr:PREDICTED: uncharacterized protein LOC108570076 [Habropoda laboriosa]